METRPTQPSIPPRSVNNDQLCLGRQRQVWFIPFVDKFICVQVKLWAPLTTRAIPERLCKVTLKISYVCMYDNECCTWALLQWASFSKGHHIKRVTFTVPFCPLYRIQICHSNSCVFARWRHTRCSHHWINLANCTDCYRVESLKTNDERKATVGDSELLGAGWYRPGLLRFGGQVSARKTVPKMTCNVSSGTLLSLYSLTHSLLASTAA